MSEMSVIVINDILDELRDENIRLKKDLLLAQNYINILIKFKNYFQNNCKCLSINNNINNENKDLIDYEIQLKNVLNQIIENQKQTKLLNHEIIVDKNINICEEKTVNKNNNKNNNKNTKLIKRKFKTNKKSFSDSESDWTESEDKSFKTNKRVVKNELFKCDFENCGKTFKYCKALETHKYKVHENVNNNQYIKDKIQFHCSEPDCNFKTFHKQNIKDHKNVHTNETPYQCDQQNCGKPFRFLASLRNHKRTVHREELLVCSWLGCEFTTKWKHRLDTHCLIHLGEKPFKCDWPGCEFSTAYPTKLKNHKYRHTGEKPYKCLWPECEWVFREKGHLNTHMLKHTGHKPWTCAECGQRFQTKQAMRFHFERRHKD